MYYFSSLNWPLLQLRSTGLCLFVTVYLSLFLIASVILFTPLFRSNVQFSEYDVYSNIRKSELIDRRFIKESVSSLDYTKDELFDYEVNKQKNDYVWLNSLLLLNETFHVASSSTSRGLKWPTMSTVDNHRIDCSTLQEVTDLEFIAAGWTKAVYRGKFRGDYIAVKTVNLNGHDIQQCLKRVPQPTVASCYRRAAAKILKELILLTELSHGNLVKVIGSCVPDAVGPVVIATELGDPLDIVKLLQLSWEHRLQLALGVARILHHFAHSPLGSLAMHDLRRQQFVLVGNTLKLSDVDDVGISEPTCHLDKDCIIYGIQNGSIIDGVPCSHGFCVGYNERLNIWRAGQHFIRQFLPLRAPSSLEPHIQNLVDAYSRSNSWNSERILQATEKLLMKYTSGKYSNSNYDGYKELTDTTVLGLDYNCTNSKSHNSCIHMIDSLQLAVPICNSDPMCNAVVIKASRNFTVDGTYMAVLKSGVGKPEKRKGYTVLLKPR
ncbi:extracellular tyrosine-protein kinase PKDCC-like [Lycorma delicatula]|uniref:extracellular tyrosine-protein kinase PKDCC-like n=1 Tax=Lycorma delicatula TaxID=130591 RepID=UPI003F515ED7